MKDVRGSVWIVIAVIALLLLVIAHRFRQRGSSNSTARQATLISNEVTSSRLVKFRRQAVALADEPTHLGRPVSEWIEDLKSSDPKSKQTAWDALIAMGPAAVPALKEALNDIRILNSAAFILANIGKEGLPVLLESLTNGASLTRKEVAGAGVMQVGALLPFESEIAPVLARCMHDSEAIVRGGAVNALQSYWKQREVVIPPLLDCLRDSNANVRGSAVTVIRKFRQVPESALSDLVRLARNDPDDFIRTRAAESLRVISPERTTKEGL
jgi:HEAT repeat protein